MLRGPAVCTAVLYQVCVKWQKKDTSVLYRATVVVVALLFARVRPRCSLVVRKLREATQATPAGRRVCGAYSTERGHRSGYLGLYFFRPGHFFFLHIFCVEVGLSNQVEAICVIEH